MGPFGLIPTVGQPLPSVVGHLDQFGASGLSIWTTAGRRLTTVSGWRWVVILHADITDLGLQAAVTTFAHSVTEAPHDFSCPPGNARGEPGTGR
jgi:hypothetical protein